MLVKLMWVLFLCDRGGMFRCGGVLLVIMLCIFRCCVVVVMCGR